MKHKLIFITLTLALLASVFSVSAFAGAGQENLTVNEARIEGDMLKIDVTDTQSGASSTLDLNLKDYDLSKEYISVQAVDADGNKSNTVKIKNPYYTAPVTETESAIPSGAFTPDGDGTVIDNMGENDGKEFFTIKTAADNEFFLIVDRKRDTDNVYFLNAITEADLLEMAQKGSNGSTTTSAIPTPTPQETEPSPEPSPEPKPSQDGGNGFMIFIVIGAIVAGGAGWYFKVYRPKQQAVDNDEPDEDGFDDDNYDDDPDDELDDDSEIEDGEDE